MRVSNYARILVENTEGSAEDRLRSYTSKEFDKAGKNPVMGKNYLMKSPRGRPMLFMSEKIHKATSIWHAGELTYGKVAGAPEWYIAWNRFGTTGKSTTGAIVVVTRETAVKMMKDLSIPVTEDKLPTTSGLNAKPVSYTVL